MTRSAIGSAAALLAVLSACSGSSGDHVAGTPVTGTRLNTYYQDDGSVQTRVAADLAQSTVSALFVEGGSTHESPGTFDTSGGFSIPDVGADAYLLRFASGSSPRYYEESARMVDLGTELVGRPSRTFALQSSTLTFSVTNLEAWDTTDTVTVLSTGARFFATPTTSVGYMATSGDFMLDLKNRPLPAAGDLAWVLQSATRTVPSGMTYTVVARSAMLQSAVTMADGDSATLAFPLGVPLDSGTVGLDLRRSQFVAALPSIAPTGTVTPFSFTVSVRGYPWTVSSSLYGTILSFTPPAGTTDVDLGTVSYPRPFPAWFKECRVLELMYQVQMPGALGMPGSTFFMTNTRIDPLPDAPTTIAPALGPVQLPLIAGRDALQPQAGVGLTPTISWSPPALGSPTRYVVAINELNGGSFGPGTIISASRGSVVVTGTSVTLPPLMLVPGSVYYATITAISEPGFDFAAPNRITAPRDSFPLIIAPFSP